MKTILETINECKINYQPMSNRYDLFCEYLILKKHNPKKIMEIGAGAAGWALTINELINSKELEFVLIEDFRQTNYQGFEWWPKNGDELVDYISSKGKNFNYKWQEKYINNDQVDVFRFDAWGTSYNKLFDIVNSLVENSVILFDDFAFNKDPDLIIMVLELAKNKIIYPIWASEKVSCWSRSNNYSQYLKSYLEDQKDLINDCVNIKLVRKHYTVLDIDLDIVQTQIHF